ncbi:MAG: short-chain dehydrogenase, partial [Actinomycetes bacterium]
LDEVSAQAALDVAPSEYAASLYAYLVSDLSTRVTGQILIAAGGFVGRFDRPAPALLGYRNHDESPPWSISEIDQMFS